MLRRPLQLFLFHPGAGDRKQEVFALFLWLNLEIQMSDLVILLALPKCLIKNGIKIIKKSAKSLKLSNRQKIS